MYPIYEIDRQERYSRLELLLRTVFGWAYIVLPHAFLLGLLGIWSSILTFVAFWSILFTGRYPESMFEFQEKLLNWSARFSAVTLNLVDGYPAFGLDAEHPGVELDIPYPETLNRGEALLKLLFGWVYVLIPHGFILLFRLIATQVLAFIAWWVVLFTAEYPEEFHRFNVGTLRWSFRVNLYMTFMTDRYPPFSGRPDIDIPDPDDPLNLPEPELLADDGDNIVPG